MPHQTVIALTTPNVVACYVDHYIGDNGRTLQVLPVIVAYDRYDTYIAYIGSCVCVDGVHTKIPILSRESVTTFVDLRSSEITR